MNREIAVSLGHARRLAGNPSWTTIRDRLRDLIGDNAPSTETLRRWHDPENVPTKPLEFGTIACLAIIYDVPISTITPALGLEAERMRVILQALHEVEHRHTGGYPGPRVAAEAPAAPIAVATVAAA